jgi:hypothetical protein
MSGRTVDVPRADASNIDYEICQRNRYAESA